MGRRQPNRSLAALLTEADWTAGELARAVNALGVRYGLRLRYDRTAIAHWLDGSRPRPPVPGLVAQAFGRRIGRVVHVGETGLTPVARPAHETVLTTGDFIQRLSALCRADADPASRLALNRQMFTATDVRLPDWPAPVTPATGPGGATGGRGRPVDDPRLTDVVVIFTDLTEKYGGAHARSALGAYLADDVRYRLLAASHQDAQDFSLLGGSARLTHLLGWMAVDAGLPNFGYHCYWSALEQAHRAGERNVFPLTLRAMSMLALRLDDVPHARQWARSALEGAGPTVPPAVLARLYAGRATVRAVDGERRAALDDLLAAERHLEAADQGDADPFRRYPLAAFLHRRGEVLLALGDRAEAVSAFRESLAARPPNHRIARVLTHTHLSRTLLALGELETALDECRQALGHYEFTASHRATTALTAVGRALAPYRRHAGARELRARITEATGPGGAR